MATFASHLPAGGLHSARAAANAVPAGTLYYETDTKKIFQSDGVSTWSTWADLSALGGAMASDTLWDTKGDLAVATGADAASKLAAGSNGQVLTADSTQTTGLKWAPAGGAAITLITSQVLSGTQASFDTNTLLGGVIPTSYNHLEIWIQGRGDTAATSTNLYMRFNNDSGSNYDVQGLNGSAAATAAFEQFAVAQLHCGEVPAASTSAGIFSEATIKIANYNGTTAQKTSLSDCSGKRGTSTGNLVRFDNAGWWRNTAAITRLAVFPAAGNFAAGTSFYLYGVT